MLGILSIVSGKRRFYAYTGAILTAGSDARRAYNTRTSRSLK